MEGAPKRAAKIVKVGLSAAMTIANPTVHNMANPLEQRIELPARPRDLKANLAKEENGKLVIQAPTPEQMAQVLESKKEKEA